MIRRQVSVLSLVAFLACATPAAAAEIAFQSNVFDLGSTFDVSILVSDAPDLYTYGFDLLFDPNVLLFQSVANGNLLPDAGFASFSFENLVNVGNSLEGPVPGVLGNGVLAVLTFQAIGVGPANLEFLSAFLSNSLPPDPTLPVPPNQIPLVPMPPVAGNITVAPITPVPEPSSLALLGVGLLATARRLRRRRHASNQTT